MLLTINQFLGSRLTLHKFALFLDSNRNACSNSEVNWYIAYHYAFDSPNGFFFQMVLSTPVLLVSFNILTCYSLLFRQCGMAEKEVKAGFSHSHNLEQYVLLAKSARGAGLVALINQALEAPGVFVFGELLEMPSVKEVCHVTLPLKIFYVKV